MIIADTDFVVGIEKQSIFPAHPSCKLNASFWKALEDISMEVMWCKYPWWILQFQTVSIFLNPLLLQERVFKYVCPTAGIAPINDWLNLESINGRETRTRSVMNAVKVKEESTWMKIAVPSVLKKSRVSMEGLHGKMTSSSIFMQGTWAIVGHSFPSAKWMVCKVVDLVRKCEKWGFEISKT